MWARKISTTSSNATAPSLPDVEEPRDVREFLDELLINFEAAASNNLQMLADFKHNPRDSLHMLGTRFNRTAVATETNNLMSSHSLSLALLQHLPLMIRDMVEEEIKNNLRRGPSWVYPPLNGRSL